MLPSAPEYRPAATVPPNMGGPNREWRAYAGNLASTKYLAVDQINAGNASQLRISWRWKSPDAEILAQHRELTTWKFEATPVMVKGVLYTSTSLSQVAAIDAATGRTLWIYDPHSYERGVTPPNMGFVHRGVAYWSDGSDARILIGTADAYLIALDAATGKIIPGFGENGRVDLTMGLRRSVDRKFYSVDSPPIICKDTVIVGSNVMDSALGLIKAMPPGDVRGFDVRTGKLRWTFHTIPLGDDYGSTTWDNESWREAGGANVWAPMSADERLGYVYLPVSAASSDYYGGHRPGNELFSNSLVCLDAATGRRIWHFQMVHHGLWDYDPPAAPILVNIRVRKHLIRAVAQVTKQAFVYVFDRTSGKPVWPIVERKVPQSTIPGERTSPTQPIPTLPKPFDQQGLSVSDLIDFTPALHAAARIKLESLEIGPLFLPPSERGTVSLPGSRGGASWAGAAYDPESSILYIPSITAAPDIITLIQVSDRDFPEPYRESLHPLTGPQGLPITKPPWGRVTAIDLNTGAHVWMQPVGTGPTNHPALQSLKLGRLGWPYRSFPLVTKTLLFIAQEGPSQTLRTIGNHFAGDFDSNEPSIQAFDKRSGKLVTSVPIPSNASGAPLTYMVHGKQFIVVAIGGGNIPAELIALSLP